MYLDFIKVNYTDKPEAEQYNFIERDKKHLGRIIQDRITEDIENIVERWYALEDIGVIEEKGIFTNLLKEAEELFSFGYYVGTISLIGTAAEELCKKIVEKNNLEANNISQFDRINLLYNEQKIILPVKQLLHSIRKIRNSYIHANDWKLYENTFLEEQAIKIIISFKEVLKNTLQLSEIDYSKVVDKLISNQDISFVDFKYRYRNILMEENIDLQLEVTNKPRVVTSFFTVMDLDIDTEDFKEMTLLDLNSPAMVVVDLTVPQVKNIRRLKLEVKNGIVATLLSQISSVGQTEEWLLLDIYDVYRGEIEI